MGNDRIEVYWRSYLNMLPADSPVRDEQYIAEGWGDSQKGKETVRWSTGGRRTGVSSRARCQS